MPVIDGLGTLFIREELPIQYTISNIFFVSGRSGYKSGSSETSTFSLSYALEVLKALGKQSAGEITAEYSKQFESTMTFFIENSKALWELQTKSTRINESYRQLMSEVPYNYNEVGKPVGDSILSSLRREIPVKPNPVVKMVKVGDEKAGLFMKRINDIMTDRLDQHFKSLGYQMPKRET